MFVFFFQAEDGIRDADVTGVQTCALPILGKRRRAAWIALAATSKATVSKPRAAMNSASSPRPQPTTSARRPRPRSRPRLAHSSSSRLGAPPHGTTASPAPACAYRRSNQPTGSPRARESAARRRACSYGSGLLISLGAPPSLPSASPVSRGQPPKFPDPGRCLVLYDQDSLP